jgi:hypothetical protein
VPSIMAMRKGCVSVILIRSAAASQSDCAIVVFVGISSTFHASLSPLYISMSLSAPLYNIAVTFLCYWPGDFAYCLLLILLRRANSDDLDKR